MMVDGKPRGDRQSPGCSLEYGRYLVLAYVSYSHDALHVPHLLYCVVYWSDKLTGAGKAGCPSGVYQGKPVFS